MIGWASAPYDPYWAARHPGRALVMAMAGPAANLLLVLLSGAAIRIGLMTGHFLPPDAGDWNGIHSLVAGADPGPWTQLAKLLSIVFMLNLILMVFNLIPLPPLDGSAIWPLVLSPGALARYRELSAQPTFALLGLFVAWNLFPKVFFPVMEKALGLLYLGLQ